MDDLLDLSWSDKDKPAALAAPQAHSARSAFDLLAKPSGPNYSYSRTTTPGTAPTSGATSPLPRAVASPAARASPAPAGDAFSALLSGTGGSTPASRNMTMAERSAQLAAEKQKKAEAEKSRWDNGDFWDKQLGGGGGGAQKARTAQLDMLAPTAPAKSPAPASAVPLGLRPSPSLSPAPASAQPASAGSFWDMQSGPSKSSSTSLSSKGTAPASKDAFDDLDGFLSAPSTSTKPTKPTPAAADPWDLDALAATVDYASEDDDLLGELGRPAKPKTKAQTPPVRSSSNSPPARAGSPPPHIVGQIVEMGFSPAQARTALAATATGLDVQAALESLLGGGREDDDMELDDERIAREMQAREDRESARRVDRDDRERDPERERRARHAARRAGPSRDSVQREEGDFTAQADQLMAQASEIGASMFSKATSLWNTGKERALKAYEEQKRALDAQNASKAKKKPADGRPRWMVEAEEVEAAAAGGAPRRTEERNGNGHGNDRNGGDRNSGFRDDFDLPPSPPQQPRRAKQAAPPSSVDTARRVESLFDDAPRPYVSKNRHPKGRSTPQPAASPAPRRPATPLVTRTLVPATPAQTSTAAQHKQKGNDHFKLGRYAEADAAYTTAIGALPAGHLHLVTLHNNRAATRLKLGESATCIADCTAAITLVGPAYHPAKEAPVDTDVKLGDALVKATVKRAQAYEMAEKWKLALDDWERVLGFDAALGATPATKSQASEGVRRAKRALEGGDKGDRPAAKAPAPKPKPAAKPVDVSRSAAVSGMRAAAAVAAAEDVERAALKDAVDAKIEGWKKGKETNLRALLASLDTVIDTPVKVGMHELVTEKQVKIRYMRVVARLHPDKLQAGMSVEQRMLASGAFGVLSEAWAAFNA